MSKSIRMWITTLQNNCFGDKLLVVLLLKNLFYCSIPYHFSPGNMVLRWIFSEITCICSTIFFLCLAVQLHSKGKEYNLKGGNTFSNGFCLPCKKLSTLSRPFFQKGLDVQEVTEVVPYESGGKVHQMYTFLLKQLLQLSPYH